MSYTAEFIFNIPPRFKEPADLAEWLNVELGLSLKPGRDGRSWDGPHIGLFLYFTPRHGTTAEPGLPYDEYRSSIALTGFAGQGDLRVILLSAVINIALAMCYHSEFEGIVIWDGQARIAHLGVNGEDRRLWDFDRQTQIKSFEDLKPIITHGVQY